MSERKTLKLELLEVWSDNPRNGLNTDGYEFDEVEIINILIDVVGVDKMYNLIEDIYANKGLLGNVNPVVVEVEQKYYVYDGNRRITALKVIQEPNLIEDENLREKVTQLIEGGDKEFVKEVFVYVTDEQEALSIMDRTHSGELDGVGMISWEPYQRDLSLHKREKNLKYPFAFKISQTLNYKKKDFKKIPYTDLDRLFGSSKLREHFVLDFNSVQDDKYEDFKIKLNYLVEMFNEYKKEKGFQSFSRHFNVTSADRSEESAMTDFCCWCDDKEKCRRKYQFKSNSIELFCDETFDFSLLELEIFDLSAKNKITEMENINVKYLTPNNEEKDTIDLSIVGDWKIEIEYDGEEYEEIISIKDLLTPEIILCSTDKTDVGNTVDLRRLIIRASNSHGNDVKNNVLIKPVGIMEIEQEVLTSNNPVGQYKVQYSFTDQNGAPFSKTVELEIIESLSPLHSEFEYPPIISFDSNSPNINISFVVNKLINEINSLSLEENACVIAVSLRTVVELCFDELQLQGKLSFSNKKDIKKCIDEFVAFLKMGELSRLCSTYSRVLTSYRNENNRISLFDSNYISSYLNLATHKSVTVIDITKLDEIGKKYIAPIVVYTNLILK